VTVQSFAFEMNFARVDLRFVQNGFVFSSSIVEEHVCTLNDTHLSLPHILRQLLYA